MKKKNYFIIVLLSILVYFGGVYKNFIGTGIRCDVFMFYDHPKGGRFLSNILVDINSMLTTSLLFFLWYYSVVSKELKRVILPFLIISIVDIADYFLFYKQYSIIKLPLLIIMLILFNYKKNKK